MLTAPPVGSAETVWSPAVFEDFEAPQTIQVVPRGTPSLAGWKLEALLPGGDLGEGDLVVRRIGLRLAPGSGLGGAPVRASVTLSSTRALSVSERFSFVEPGAITFFGVARREPSAVAGSLLVLDLASGFRFRASAERRLRVRIQAEGSRPFRLEAAPSATPRLLLAGDALAATGTPYANSPVIALTLDRRGLPASPLVVSGAPGRPARVAPPASVVPAAPRLPRGPLEVTPRPADAPDLLRELEALRDRIFEIESELHRRRARSGATRASLAAPLPAPAAAPAGAFVAEPHPRVLLAKAVVRATARMLLPPDLDLRPEPPSGPPASVARHATSSRRTTRRMGPDEELLP